MHVHRHFKKIEDVMFLINITYLFEDMTIILQNFTMHAISSEGIIGENIVKRPLEEFDERTLNKVFEILNDDGVFDTHK